MQRLPRIEALLGTAIVDADEAALQRLVDGAATEDSDLDFKEDLYGSSDSEKRELAGDVAALANATGGLIILGIREEEAVAVELTPVVMSDDEEVRMRQVVAGTAAPHPSMTIHRVPSQRDADRGYYLIEVPRSPLQPHAVRVNQGLRYPRRDGTTRRWLAESEVADAYRNRFLSAETEAHRIAEVRDEGQRALPRLDAACLSVALTPSLPGAMSLTQRRILELEHFNRDVEIPRFVGSNLLESTAVTQAGHRRVVLKLGEDANGYPRHGLLHLHTDGSGYASAVVGDDHEGLDFVEVDDELLTQEAISSLALLTAHAVRNCGAAGEALIEATLIADHPMRLGHPRGAPSDSWNSGSVESAPIGRHTVDIDEITKSSTGLVIAARMVLNDLVQGFGVAESPQLTPDGALRRPCFRNRARGHVEQEAERFGLELVGEQL